MIVKKKESVILAFAFIVSGDRIQKCNPTAVLLIYNKYEQPELMHHYRYSVRYHCNVGIVPFLCDGHPKRLIHICCYFKSHLFCHVVVLFSHYIDALVLDQYPDLDLILPLVRLRLILRNFQNLIHECLWTLTVPKRLIKALSAMTVATV